MLAQLLLSLLPFKVDLYKALLHKYWEPPNSRIWMAKTDVESGLQYHSGGENVSGIWRKVTCGRLFNLTW